MNVRKPVDYGTMHRELTAILAQNLPQMDEIHAIGKVISQRPEKGAAVAAAEFLQANFPDRTGFSPRNVRRMRDFYRTYENDQTLLRLAMKIGWTLNVVIMEAELARVARKWYLEQARVQQWSKAVLLEKLASEVHLEKTLDAEGDTCYTVIGIIKGAAIRIDGVVTFDWGVFPSNMDNSLLGDIIGGAATIVSAIISVGYLGKIIHKEIAPSFFSYSEPNHNLWRLLRAAENDITIVVAYGDRLLRTQKLSLLFLLKKGIKIRFLMLTPEKALDMGTSFMQPILPPDKIQATCSDKRLKTKMEIESALDNLAQLQKNAPRKNNIDIKMISHSLTASYIAIDLSTRFTHPRQCSSIIQMMVYQFGVMSKNSPTTYLTFKNDKKQFENTADSIDNMRRSAKPVDIEKYRKELLAVYMKYWTYTIEETV